MNLFEIFRLDCILNNIPFLYSLFVLHFFSFHFLFLSLCLYLSLSLSFSFSLPLSLSLSVYFFIDFSLSPLLFASIYLSIYLSLCLFLYLSDTHSLSHSNIYSHKEKQAQFDPIIIPSLHLTFSLFPIIYISSSFLSDS